MPEPHSSFRVATISILHPPRLAGEQTVLATLTVEVGHVMLTGCRLMRMPRPGISHGCYVSPPGRTRDARAIISSKRLLADINAAAVKAFVAAGGDLKAQPDISHIVESENA